jgi:hypothetical protein
LDCCCLPIGSGGLIRSDDMTLLRWATVLLIGIGAAGADSPPEFTAAGVVRGDRRAKMVVPGTILTIYGSNLGPISGPLGTCRSTVMPPPLKDLCGTQVLIGDKQAELLFVSDNQINFKVPGDSPRSGTVEIRVVSRGLASPPMMMKAGFEHTTVSLDGPAYVDMPVWLNIDLPYEFEGAVRYPFILGLAGFGCNEVEVRRNGQPLPLLPGSDWTLGGGIFIGNICGSYSPASRAQADRLPFHLLYRFDAPGRYEVRYTLLSSPIGFPPLPLEGRTRSEWTLIEVLPANPGQRSAWLQSLRERAPSDPAELLTDILPSLPGLSDDASLEMLAEYLYHANASVRQYAMHALSSWPEKSTVPILQELLKNRGPNEEATRYLTRRRAVAPNSR